MDDGDNPTGLNVIDCNENQNSDAPLMDGEELCDIHVGRSREFYTFGVGTNMNCDETRGVGSQEGVLNQVLAGEAVSINGTGNEGTVSDAAAGLGVVDLNGSENDIKNVALIPRIREESCTEEEGEFYVSDLVWGKVRGHPWWPGLIFDPSAASQTAMKHFKRDSYLIAYFGDQTFAWNEVSNIKPYRMHFNQMEKQSSMEAFCRAVNCSLDELSRRVVFGLSCTCIPKELQHKYKSQVVVNAGIREESSKRDGGDKLSTVTSFQPAVLLQQLKKIAAFPCSLVDRLGIVTTRSQLLAFYHWKGYYQLPAVDESQELLEHDANTNAFISLEGTASGLSGDVSVPSGNVKRKRGRPPKHKTDSDSHKANDLISSESKVKRRKKVLPLEQMQSAAVQTGESTSVESISLEEVLLVLSLAAKDPINRYGVLAPFTGFFAGLREFTCSGNSKLKDNDISVQNREAKSPTNYESSAFEGLREFTSLEHSKLQNNENLPQKCAGESSIDYEAAELSALDGAKDSYWTDRIIQVNLEEPLFCEPEDEKNTFVAQSDDVFGPEPIAEEQQHEKNICVDQSDAVVVAPEPHMISQSEPEDQSGCVNGEPEEDCPTELILNFKNPDSVPLAADLNKVFSTFGPLDESQTEGKHKTKRGKVVFRRRSDAETAFSSAGKISILGPSLISYRLNYAPKHRKAPSTNRKRKKGGSSAEIND